MVGTQVPDSVYTSMVLPSCPFCGANVDWTINLTHIHDVGVDPAFGERFSGLSLYGFMTHFWVTLILARYSYGVW